MIEMYFGDGAATGFGGVPRGRESTTRAESIDIFLRETLSFGPKRRHQVIESIERRMFSSIASSELDSAIARAGARWDSDGMLSATVQ